MPLRINKDNALNSLNMREVLDSMCILKKEGTGEKVSRKEKNERLNTSAGNKSTVESSSYSGISESWPVHSITRVLEGARMAQCIAVDFPFVSVCQ